MRITRTAAVAAAAAVGIAAAMGGAPAHASGQIGPATTFTINVSQAGVVTPPADGNAIPNSDSVRSTVRNYYGATKGTDPAYAFASDLSAADVAAGVTIPAKTNLPNLTTSPYALQTTSIANSLESTLTATHAANAAVVFDVDSTLLSDYGNEEDMNFGYNSDVNAIWVNHALFPAVAGMADLVKTLSSEGYTIYAITGRPASQLPGTLTNLADDGFTEDGTPGGAPIFTDANTFLKGGTATADDGSVSIPTEPWVDCSLDGITSKCSTVEVKAGTRKHIIDGLGKDIVMSVGDQWSDLEGGYADATQKIPNPSYTLPSADIPGAPSTDAQMVYPSSYTMKPDGSSGLPSGGTPVDGDAIPNIGIVTSEIQAFYGASGGKANKTTSPYITQMTSLTSTWSTEIAKSCSTEAAKVAAATSALGEAGKEYAADQKAVTKAGKAVTSANKAVTKAKKAVKKAKGKKAKKAKKKSLTAAKKKLSAAKKALTTANAALASAKKITGGVTVPAKPVAVFDADDTTLWNYDLEDGGMGFAFNPTLDTEWTMDGKFPAVPGMIALIQKVAAAGCTIVGLTGRTGDELTATIANLKADGFVDTKGNPLFTAANYFTKPAPGAAMPSYIDCGDDSSCTTIEFKSGTREHLVDDLGDDVVANLGDQFSDLHGGYSGTTYKIPNPTYYLP